VNAAAGGPASTLPTWRETILATWGRRVAARIVELRGLALGDILWPLRDRENRAWHDFLARTHVVFTSPVRDQPRQAPDPVPGG
jgi:uncharacterized RDD family membrane protein YckC